MKKSLFIGGVLLFSSVFFLSLVETVASQSSSSGVRKLTVDVPLNQNGRTTEQENIAERLLRDNKPGSIKYFYVISPETGQILMTSTVKGKVTSSGKRISPKTVASRNGTHVGREHYGFPVTIGGETKYTSEVLQDDGTYGSSSPYIFWFDVNGVYHQHWFLDGQIIHVADQPMRVNLNEITVRMGEKEE